ncbi:MAG: hypothetical protein WCC94_09695, partial [Candidatus Bathyarchaeia archaeon]
MSSRSRLDVTELERDRYARTARIRLADRQIMTPHFLTLVKNPDEFQSLLDLTTQKQPPYASGCLVRLFDAQMVLGEHLANMTQT